MSQTAPESPSTQQAPQDAVPAGEAGQQPQAQPQGAPTPPEGYVEKTRYDGQVRKVNEQEQELKRLRALVGQGPQQTQQAQPPAPAPTPQQGADGLPTMEEMVQTLFMEHVNRTQGTIVDRVVQEFPDAEPFKDVLVGSEAEVRAQAAYFAERARALKGQAGTQAAAPPNPTTTQPPTTTPVVVPGGAPPAGNPDQDAAALATELNSILDNPNKVEAYQQYIAFRRQHGNDIRSGRRG